MYDLTGEKAIVTGVSGGIGSAIARELAAHGADVVGVDLAPWHGAAPDRYVRTDVTDEQSVRTAVDAAVRVMGGVSVLVNAAGAFSSGPLEDTTTAEWDRVIAADLTSVFLVTRAVVPHMRDARHGRIVNISSQLAQSGAAEMSAYAAAKAGVIGFTKSIARELAPLGITANTVAPGPITTAMTALVDPAWVARKAAELPLRRFGHPDEVAQTVVLLASTPGGSYYTGQTLGPNGGDVMP